MADAQTGLTARPTGEGVLIVRNPSSGKDVIRRDPSALIAERIPDAVVHELGTDETLDDAVDEALAELAPSPVVELNRAMAVSRAYGAGAGLELVDALVDVPALRGYHLLPSARGDLLAQLGRTEEARGEFERAAALTRNVRERGLLLARAAACGPANALGP